MANIIQLALRTVQFLMALLIMSLIGNAIAMGADSAINDYTMFCAAWAMLFLFYLIPVSVKDFGMPIVTFAIDLLTTLFWFCGAVALAAELHVHSCNNHAYVSTNRVIRGASDQSGACREAQASTAFLWFGWAAFTVSTVLSGLSMGGGSAPRASGIRRGPAMSQV
ncbi:hypothetical protein PRZ48_004715 [Zasmidium cellare]|uniref:MARVEL domain-containing protein n=1 Tax=Zasmidium cellare TaxID=395010 RepID=A0ABR0ERB7_ZASCE|nr:hypothetical protein PRZ48_004715 [Zasmidium cellare]